MGLMTKIRVGLDYDYDYDSTIRVLIYYSYILNPPLPSQMQNICNSAAFEGDYMKTLRPIT
jgi:hypothetical protein